MYVGVDGCSDGWFAVIYNETDYVTSEVFESIDQLWEDHSDADTILIDVPIGLRENSNRKRPCDARAREILGQPRSSSVFPTPVRAAVHKSSYSEAKAAQEDLTDGSLGTQSWAIADKIYNLDTFLRTTEPDATEVIREAHPEICFWALNDEEATSFSKTSQAAAAFWERVEILERINPEILNPIRTASTGLDADVSNDDIVDAFALAITASPITLPVQTLPKNPPTDDDGDPKGLPMEMVYAFPRE